MAHLSVLSGRGVMVGCASPIYLTSEADYGSGSKLTFELLEADASLLKLLVGKTDTFSIDSRHPRFLAELTSLEPCESTVAALAPLRHQPAMRGILTVLRAAGAGESVK